MGKTYRDLYRMGKMSYTRIKNLPLSFKDHFPDIFQVTYTLVVLPSKSVSSKITECYKNKYKYQNNHFKHYRPNGPYTYTQTTPPNSNAKYILLKCIWNIFWGRSHVRYKISLNKLKMTEITPSIFSDYGGMQSEINSSPQQKKWKIIT